MCVGLLPPTGTGKINTDGSSHGDPGEAGIGGLIRDSGGCWGVGFTQRIGWASPITAEL
jgi:ribonuclease HI